MRLLIIEIDSVAGSVVRAILKKWPIAVQRAKSVPNWPPIGHSLARSPPTYIKKTSGAETESTPHEINIKTTNFS